MVRKTLSVGQETWDALSNLGKFGMSFDDIITKLLEEHEELIEMKNTLKAAGMSIMDADELKAFKNWKMQRLGVHDYDSQPSQQPQQQTEQHGSRPQVPTSIRPSPSGGFEYLFRLPGLKFPATKEEIFVCARKAQYSADDFAPIAFLQQLPNNKYDSKNKFEKDYSDIFKDRLRHLKGSENLAVIFVYDEPITVPNDPREVFRYNLSKAFRETMDNYAYSLSIPLPEIEKYPISKEELIEAVEALINKFKKKYNKVPLKLEQALILVKLLRKPRTEKFMTETALNIELDVLVNTEEIMEAVIGYPTKIRGCRIRFVAKNPTDSTMKDMLHSDEEQRDNYRQNRQEYLEQKQKQQQQPQPGEKKKASIDAS